MVHLLRRRKIFIIILILVILLMGSNGMYYGKALWIKKYGIEFKPSKVYKPSEVTYFLQNDSRWGKDRLGNSDHNLGGHGCLVTVLATALNELDYETNPKELNKFFREHKAYTAYGDVIWYRINETIPGIKYTYDRVFSKDTIQKDLEQGRYPIVKVRYHKTGIYHWVLIVGSTEGDFLIMDPLEQDKEFVKLKKHGKVYAYRVLKRKIPVD